MTETLIERWAARAPHFRCPQCGRISFDIARRYCGHCRQFFGQKHDFVRNRPPSYGKHAADERREDAMRAQVWPESWPGPTIGGFDPAPPSAPPDPPASIDPGGGSSGGGGASGDW